MKLPADSVRARTYSHGLCGACVVSVVIGSSGCGVSVYIRPSGFFPHELTGSIGVALAVLLRGCYLTDMRLTSETRELLAEVCTGTFGVALVRRSCSALYCGCTRLSDEGWVYEG